jgi:hypothetical protein
MQRKAKAQGRAAPAPGGISIARETRTIEKPAKRKSAR